MVLNILIIFMIFFFIYSLFMHFFRPHLLEGMTSTDVAEPNPVPSNTTKYEPYPEDPLILAKQNAANIEYLKQRINDVDSVKKDVKQNTDDIANLGKQVNAILESQANQAIKATGGKPMTVTGV